MDDTIFMDDNKRSLQISVNTAREFFKLNDIKINAKKSELIIFNSSVNREEQFIKVGGDIKDF